MPEDWNIALLHTLNGFAFRHAWSDHAIVFIAIVLPILLALGAAAFLVWRRRPFTADRKINWSAIFDGSKDALFVAATSLAAWMATYALKMLFAVPRPFLAFSDIHPLFTTGGFDALPSNHAATAAALALAVMRYDRRLGWALFAGAVLIGAARVAAGVHYPLDIAVGFLIAYIVVWYIMKYIRPWLEKRGILAPRMSVAILPENL